VRDDPRAERLHSTLRRLIGIGAAVTRRPLTHHRAYGSVHGGSSQLEDKQRGDQDIVEVLLRVWFYAINSGIED
jgi:hypothetical protein